MKASEVAKELKKLAEAIEQGGELDIPYAFIHFNFYNKDSFLEFAKAIMLRPFEKKYTDYDLRLQYHTDAIQVWAQIARKTVCTLVEPAKPAVYDCDPILSPTEELSLESEAV